MRAALRLRVLLPFLPRQRQLSVQLGLAHALEHQEVGLGQRAALECAQQRAALTPRGVGCGVAAAGHRGASSRGWRRGGFVCALGPACSSLAAYGGACIGASFWAPFWALLGTLFWATVGRSGRRPVRVCILPGRPATRRARRPLGRWCLRAPGGGLSWRARANIGGGRGRLRRSRRLLCALVLAFGSTPLLHDGFATLHFGDGGGAVLFADIAGRLAVQVKPVRRGQQRADVRRAGGVAVQEQRQRLAAVGVRRALLDVGLDAQLYRQQHTGAKQRRKLLGQSGGAGGGRKFGRFGLCWRRGC